MARKPTDDQLVFTTEKINEIKDRADNGFKITRQEKFWFSNIQPVRKNKLVFRRTTEETLDYLKCKLGVCIDDKPYFDPENQTLKQEGIEYFSEMFCKIKREDGSVGKMKLRDYQEDVLNLYMKNRFSILMASRQVGKCIDMSSTLVIQQKDTKVSKKIHYFKFLFQTKKNKNIFDYVKYGLYTLINLF